MADATSLLQVDWSQLPAPEDDGEARHLDGARLPSVTLASTSGAAVNLASLGGRTVVFAYPMTGTPGVALPDGWDEIPGARGCTPHACAFRDGHAELLAAGADRVFGLSVQSAAEQAEAATRLHLPFPLLSDAALELARAAALPVMDVGGRPLLKRLALVVDDAVVTKVFYPVFPPDRNAGDVLVWLKTHPR